MRAGAALLAGAIAQTLSTVASAGMSVGLEANLGTLGPGQTGYPPLPVLAADATGVVAAFIDNRAFDERELFVQRLSTAGAPLGTTALVAADMQTFLLVGTQTDALVLWSPGHANTDGFVESAFIRPDGRVDAVAELAGLTSVPTSMACLGMRCVAVTATGFQSIDLDTRTAGAPFSVAALEAVSPSSPVLAAAGERYVALCSATSHEKPAVLTAELDASGSIVRHFELQATLDAQPSSIGLIAGTGDLMATATIGSVLHVIGLDGHGRANHEANDLPLGHNRSSAGTFAASAYHFALEGSPPNFASVTSAGSATMSVLSLDSSPRFVSLVPRGDGVLAAKGSSELINVGPPSPGDATNLVAIAVDGSVEGQSVVGGERPSAQTSVLLAGAQDRFLVAYSQSEPQLNTVRYALLDANGKDAGASGRIGLVQNATTAAHWSLSEANGRFLLAGGGIWLFDASGAWTEVPLALPTEAGFADDRCVVLGADEILELDAYAGSCGGEDCVWYDIGARRYALDGTLLDAKPLFGPDLSALTGRSGGSGRLLASPGGIWNGQEFVAFAFSDASFRRIAADGTLIDAGWRRLDPTGTVLGSAAFGYATAGGTTLVAWVAGDFVYATRIFPDGTTDPTPIKLAPARSTPPDPTTGINRYQSAIAVTHDGGRFIVAWECPRGACDDGVLFAAALDADGTVEPRVTLTNYDSTPNPHRPALASLGDGRALLGYYRFDSAPTDLTARAKLRFVTAGPSPLGSSCLADIDCASGFCVDGVCCDSRCDDAGMSCATADTGRGEGTCAANRPAAADTPDAGAARAVACVTDGDCPAKYTCDTANAVCVRVAAAASPGRASGSCRQAPPGTPSLTWVLSAFALACGSVLRRRSRVVLLEHERRLRSRS